MNDLCKAFPKDFYSLSLYIYILLNTYILKRWPFWLTGSYSLSIHCPLTSQLDPTFNCDNLFQNSKTAMVKTLNSANVMKLPDYIYIVMSTPHLYV